MHISLRLEIFAYIWIRGLRQGFLRVAYEQRILRALPLAVRARAAAYEEREAPRDSVSSLARVISRPSQWTVAKKKDSTA